jgi:hypothetical protein
MSLKPVTSTFLVMPFVRDSLKVIIYIKGPLSNSKLSIIEGVHIGARALLDI